MTNQISVERTGNIFSIAGSEYKAIFPDGSTQIFWSPPWHDYDSEEEDANALLYAAQQYAEKIKVKKDVPKSYDEVTADVRTELEDWKAEPIYCGECKPV